MSEPSAPVPPRGDGPYVCEICGRVLDYEEGVGYLHTAGDSAAGHEPMPVPQSQALVVAGRCDFCYADHPAWVVPARDFEVLPGHVSNGDWAACSDCGRLIETDQWSALTRRARRGWEQIHGPMPDHQSDALPRLYRLLRKNITGALRPNPGLGASGGSGAKFGSGWKTGRDG